MSKRNNVTYVKPNEPNFLRKLKEEIGYKEGPTVDTKRENLDTINREDLEDLEDEQPTVVVLKPGDLTAEEASKFKEELDKESKETQADLTERIVFKRPTKDNNNKETINSNDQKRPSSTTSSGSSSKSSKKLKKNSNLLSFDEEKDDN